MAKITLPTNYRDDILNSSAYGKRKYIMSYNQDGTVSFEDVTPYEQVGSDYGAGDINTTNEAVNESFDKNKLIKDLDTINALTEEGYAPDALAFRELTESLTNENNESFNFGYKDGVRGFFTNPSRADDSFIPFSSGSIKEFAIAQRGYAGNGAVYNIGVYTINSIEVMQGNNTIVGEYIKVSNSTSNATFTALKKGKYAHVNSNITIPTIIECEENEVIYTGGFDDSRIGTLVFAL